MRIVTDSRSPEEPKDPDDDTVFRLYREFAPPDDVRAMQARYERGGIGYGEAKNALFEALDDALRAPRARFRELMEEGSELDRVLAAGAVRARELAGVTVGRMRAAAGVA
jgi:tryptophanyl-tRNA synthetase